MAAPKLDLDAGPLCGTLEAVALLGPEALAAPEVTPDGGFEGYIPIPELAPHEAIVVELRR